MYSRMPTQIADHLLLPWEDEEQVYRSELPTVVYMVSSVLALFATYAVFVVYDTHTVLSLTREDGLFEYLGATFFLLASGVFFLAFRASCHGNDLYLLRTRKNIFFVLLSLIFFIGAAEEISWGQRVFGFETPPAVGAINEQQEFNIHNLPLFHGFQADGVQKTGLSSLFVLDRMFSLFWLSYCFLLPCVAALSRRWATLLQRMNLPLVSIGIGCTFVLNYALSKLVEGYIFSLGIIELDMIDALFNSMQEIKEANCAVLFFTVSVYFLRLQNAQRERVREGGIV